MSFSPQVVGPIDLPASIFVVTEVMSLLPEDILLEILSRLPGKALFRCKSVCKLWRALISNPSFVLSAAGRERAINGFSPYGMKSMNFCSIDDDLTVVKLPNPTGKVPSDYDKFRFLGSCDGLILFYADESIYLWNPLTSCCRELTQLGALAHRLQAPSLCRATLSGFCFDKASNDYKLVVVTPPFSRYCRLFDQCVFVASLKKREVCMDIRFPYDFGFFNGDSGYMGALVSGHLHWLVHKQKQDHEQVIIYFDQERNQFREMPMPIDHEHGFRYVGLTNLYGCLSVSRATRLFGHGDRGFSGYDDDFLIMREYGDNLSWTKLLTMNGCLVPLHTRISNKLVLITYDHSLYSYNFESKSCQKMEILRNHEARAGPLMFTESLASVDAILQA
ncbi:OLC1v1009889C1 [Oldenlandia corymbosa var. corymbosa]|uniref:OLC1v1009889C1 n=1 Tax=Oldenlandia corymbosa var. corymbosa TaxID=529605 RepID=A0AAV1DPZ7_OLDCO|nr:OLC1v1009889C1 [Oldenlandia corymbosa var. corymbosa]